jgi:hypothetical protein
MDELARVARLGESYPFGRFLIHSQFFGNFIFEANFRDTILFFLLPKPFRLPETM